MSLVASIVMVGGLVSNLTQIVTNGLSSLGTTSAPLLPAFLTNNPLPNGFPWDLDTASNTNPYIRSPKTTIVRNYDFTMACGYIAPDGVNRNVILINGQFPGPTIQANWGDMIEVTVHNQISGPQEGTALHWHGLLQKETPCPSSDYYHNEYFQIFEGVMSSANVLPRSDNNLINGKMDYNCSNAPTGVSCTPNAGLSKFPFHTGKTHRLRLINAGAEGMQRFTIDNHTMTVIANDFVPIVPYTTNVVTLAVGQRTDVLVKATGKATDSVWMRSDISGNCSLSNQPHALAAIYYSQANMSATPTPQLPNTTTLIVATYVYSQGERATAPFFPIAPLSEPATVQTIDITFAPNASGINLWYMNDSTFRADYKQASPPPLVSPTNPLQPSPPPARLRRQHLLPSSPTWNVYAFGANTSIRLIVRNHFPTSHPMHLHGHNFFVLAEGPGDWDGATVARPQHPQRRDVQLVQPRNVAPGAPSHLVVEFNADNPGVWPFHCHIAWHVSAGLYVNIIERPDLITEKQIPAVVAQTCADWAAYTNSSTVDQIDSGL
ncbi:hypothetical protein MMC13_006988 [Lambiella insularis]|nr:hypothetical protein [Lambiella insularis]